MAGAERASTVDFNHLESYVAGDRALVREVLALFSDQARTVLPTLDPKASGEAWRDAAHSLKGSALGVGAFQVAGACEAAEAAFEAPLGVKAARLLDVRDALDRALADIAAYVHERALQSLKPPPLLLDENRKLP